jgi:exosortase/archaeosortase family protein
MRRNERKRLESVVWFLIRFNVLAIPLYVVMYLGLTFAPMQDAIAYISHGILSAMGYSLLLSGNLIYGVVGNQPIEITVSWDSTGWKSLYALAALVLATPVKGYVGKLKFLALALPTIFAINVARILTTLLVSFEFGLENFQLVHDFLWSGGMIAAVVALWLVWLRKKRIIFGKTKFF